MGGWGANANILDDDDDNESDIIIDGIAATEINATSVNVAAVIILILWLLVVSLDHAPACE